MDSKNPCIVIFCGQPKLILQLERQTHEALRQRIAVNYTFIGLSRAEVKDYILSRFKACSKNEPPLEETAYEFIYTTTGGAPRKINKLMTMALLLGFKEKQTILTPEILLKANDENTLKAP